MSKRVERGIKLFVAFGKNFLFVNTSKGEQNSTIFFILIETAKENGLDPYRYLVWLLSEVRKLAQNKQVHKRDLTISIKISKVSGR